VKIFVHRLKEHLVGIFELAGKQYGFIPGKSTLDALDRLNTVVRKANGRGFNYNGVVGMLMLDIKNALNSARWSLILDALGSMNVPRYLTNYPSNI